MSSRPQPQTASRSLPPPPKTIKLSPHRLLSLPYRLTHPPPPQPKASSPWAITPHFRIPLEEILDRKHLPPLGLKDFEEWLLLIDGIPECLYFILWLREYKARYTAWMRKTKLSSPIRCSSNPDAQTYRSISVPAPPNPALVQFYMRAKETFLTPYAPYALPLPLDVLAQFSPISNPSSGAYRPPDHMLGVPGQPPHPLCPDAFGEVEERVIAMLTDSLDRFVVATFHNVGMPRAYCGCAGGTVIGLSGSVPVLLANFLTGGSRWWRFAALPGLWLGMTIVISALYGVCMMIYVFGDLRQLRSFELARILEPGAPSEKGKEQAKPNMSSVPNAGPQPHAIIQAPLTGPPPLRRYSPSFAPAHGNIDPLSRPGPPKLRLTTPPPAHTAPHVHTSHRLPASHQHMQSVSSASTSYSVKAPHKSLSVPFSFPEDDDSSFTDSAYESDEDYGSETDAGSDDSHTSGSHEGTSVESAADGDRRRRRRRRREPRIHISDAIFDEDPSPEGPAMGDYADRAGRSSIWGEDGDGISMGATFIYPFQWDDMEASSCSHDLESQARCASERQRIDTFDFDGLPRRSTRQARRDSATGSLASPTTPTFAPMSTVPHVAPTDPEKQAATRGVHFASDVEGGRGRCSPAHGPTRGPIRKFLGMVQTKCGPRNIASYILGSRAEVSTSVPLDDLPDASPPPGTPAAMAASASASACPLSPTSTLRAPSVVWPAAASSVSEKTAVGSAEDAHEAKGQPWQVRLRRMLEVPAFASPLTPVLNPVVTRGQWEIVVRSAVIALLCSTAVVGGLVGVPVTHA